MGPHPRLWRALSAYAERGCLGWEGWWTALEDLSPWPPLHWRREGIPLLFGLVDFVRRWSDDGRGRSMLRPYGRPGSSETPPCGASLRYPYPLPEEEGPSPMGVRGSKTDGLSRHAELMVRGVSSTLGYSSWLTWPAAT